MNYGEIKNKIEEIKNKIEVKKVTRVENTRYGFKIYYTISLEYARKNDLQYVNRIYEYNEVSNIKEIEYADTQCIFIF